VKAKRKKKTHQHGATTGARTWKEDLMFRTAIVIAGLVMVLLAGPALAADDGVSAPTGGLSYDCVPRGDDGNPTCTCTGFIDCQRMREFDVCEQRAEGNRDIDIMTCPEGSNQCTCTWDRSRAATQDRRQDAFDPSTEVAPPTRRDHRTNSSSGSSNQNAPD